MFKPFVYCFKLKLYKIKILILYSLITIYIWSGSFDEYRNLERGEI